MSGTKAGGLLTRDINYQNHGRNFYRTIGAKGGKLSTGGGFASMTPERRKELGRKGGYASHRTSYSLSGTTVVQYLDATKDSHNGYDGSTFAGFYEDNVSYKVIAAFYGVSDATVLKWGRYYRKNIGKVGVRR